MHECDYSSSTADDAATTATKTTTTCTTTPTSTTITITTFVLKGDYLWVILPIDSD